MRMRNWRNLFAYIRHLGISFFRLAKKKKWTGLSWRKDGERELDRGEEDLSFSSSLLENVCSCVTAVAGPIDNNIE